MAATILKEIQNPKGKVFRKLWVKRRLASTGLFETDWQEITKDVKSWGSISKSIDNVRYSRVRFSDASIVVANDYGRYNPESDESSFWYGYASQNRSMVKIEAGFINQTCSASGIWTNTFLPSDPTVFVGVLQGDIELGASNEVLLPVTPLLQVFRDFSTRNLSGLTTTGMTASQFIGVLRDQTDGAGGFIFRPFFGDTTANWNYTSSSIVYADLTSTITSAQPQVGGSDEYEQNDFLQMNVWDAIEKLAEAENSIPYITRDGKFKFVDRTANTTTAAFGFYGRGFNNRYHGITIKKVNSYKTKVSDFYSRVELKWQNLATTTAVVSTQTAMVVGNNNAWNYGHRTFSLDNNWVATVTSARTLASSIFDAVSTVNRELNFDTSFVPHLEVLDLVSLNYDSTELDPNSRWDMANWAADNTNTADDLIWAGGDAMAFVNNEFKLTAIDINLDTFECNFTGLKTGGSGDNVSGNLVGSAIIGDAVLG